MKQFNSTSDLFIQKLRKEADGRALISMRPWVTNSSYIRKFCVTDAEAQIYPQTKLWFIATSVPQQTLFGHDRLI